MIGNVRNFMMLKIEVNMWIIYIWKSCCKRWWTFSG